MSSPGLPTQDIPAGITAEQAAVLASQQAYAQQQEQLRAMLAGSLVAIWAGVSLFPDLGLPAARRYVDQILPLSLGAQRAMAAATVAHMNSLIRPPAPIAISLDSVTGEPLRKRNPSTYYDRPFAEVRYQLSRGKPLGEALEAGRRRAESIALTDIQLAHTHAAQAVIEQAEEGRRGRERTGNRRGEPVLERTITGYRRVLSNRPNHCALCVLASTRRYHVRELMPIHPACSCRVEPIFEDEPVNPEEPVLDPQRVGEVAEIVRRDLGDKYVDPGGRGPIRYRDIVIVHNHGELGPVLGVRGHNFRGPKDIPNLGHDRVNPPDEELFDNG